MSRHLSTRKHKSSVDGIKMELNYINLHSNKHQCNCGKEYKSQSGLWKHQQKCNIEFNNEINIQQDNIQINNDVKAATSQMSMSRTVITFADFQPVLVVAKSLLCRHTDRI